MSGITYTIPGASLLDQLHEATMDGLPDENANDNCVATSIAEGLHILTGKTFVGDELKDAVYGQGYVGVQSALRYVTYCAVNEGVALTAVNGSQATLIAEIHAAVSAGCPVLVTMPSMWGTAPADPIHPAGSTHVGVAIGEGPGMIRVMNPWHGFYQDESDAWWQARLCYGQVWPMRKIGATTMWTNAGAGNARDSHGVLAHNAMASYLLAHPTLGDVVAGCPGETYYDAGHSFLPLTGDTVLQWDTKRGTVAEAGGEVSAALYNELKQAQDHAAQLQAQIAQLQTQLANTKPSASQLAAVALVNALKQALS